MKLTALMIGFAMSSAAFAAFPAGLELTNLPTASKSYSKTLSSADGVASATDAMTTQCLKDLEEAQAFIARTGSKVLSVSGCTVNVQDNSSCDQGGCGEGIVLSTSFKVLFK